jgi:hypothetical protein
MRQSFEALREQLLRAGYSPWRVGRYCRELSDHFADLVADERAAGKELAEAQGAARARIGSDDELAAAMLMRPSLRTWTAKAPVSVVVMAPMMLLILASIVTVLVLMSRLGTHPGALPQALQDEIRDISGFENFQLPVLVSALIGLWAARNRLPARLAVLGVLGVACVSAALRVHILWPGYNPADPTRWAIEAMPSRVVPMWLQRFREVGLLDLAVGLAVFWAASGPRLGRGEPIAADARARSTSRTWAAKAPWAALVLLPVALMVLASALSAMALTAWLGPHPTGSTDLLRSRFACLYGTVHLLPWLTCAGVLLAAARQRASVIWPILGLLAVAGVGAALQIRLQLPGDPTLWAAPVGSQLHPISTWLQRFYEMGPLLAVGMTVYLAVRFGSAPPPKPALA